jgi:hypothetical protein
VRSPGPWGGVTLKLTDKLDYLSWPLCRDDPELGQMRPDCIGHHRALTHQQAARPVQGLDLYRDKAHVRPSAASQIAAASAEQFFWRLT